MSELQRYTWDQAKALHAWSPSAFVAVGIKASTVRKWASRGHIAAVGVGPNGCKLYLFEEVVRHARRAAVSAEPGNTSLMCHTGVQAE